MPVDTEKRFDLLDDAIARDLVIRGLWRRGSERACLLLTLAPEIEENLGDSEEWAPLYRIEACPSELLPLWLAALTPEIDDRGSAEAWPTTIRRYASVVRRAAHTLDADGWHFVHARFHGRVIRKIAEKPGLTELQAAALAHIQTTGQFLLPDTLASALTTASYGKGSPPDGSAERTIGSQILQLETIHWQGGQPRACQHIALSQIRALTRFFLGIEPEYVQSYDTEQAWDIYANLLLDTIEAALPPEGPVDEHQNSV